MHARHNLQAMNLTWLEDFLALAASGNFSRAADERHLTQPAFSRRIRALEDWIGIELFDRTRQPAVLTEAGEWFRATAEEVLARVARIPVEARAIAESQATTLRFAATHALSFAFLPAWLRRLEAHAALGPVSLVSDVLQRCEALLLQGEVQFLLSHAHAAVPSELDAQGYPSLQVGEAMLLPVSLPGVDGKPLHRLAEGVALAGYSPESGIGRILRAVHGASLDALAVHTVFTAHLASVLRSVVLDGRGLAWLPQSLVQDDLASGRLVEAGALEWRIAMQIRLYRDRSTLGPAAAAFWIAVQGDDIDPERGQ
ncbi:LysR substrate-binding domain-containing protein [soil metagenome]